tara:strand:- start:2623 stop:2820 length:198 start_codon:yes stop_codon:yes gene_type:complete
MEKNSNGVDAITHFQNSTCIPVFSIITIVEIYNYLRNGEFDDFFTLEESTINILEDYLFKYCEWS